MTPIRTQTALLPEPVLLGLPAKFNFWRPGQDRAVLAGIDSVKKFVVQAAPTGFGKTATYIAQALLSGSRCAILTATKGLQSQLVQDFAECGLLDMRGQSNYKCKAIGYGGELHGEGIGPGDRCDAGPCHAGVRCSLKTNGCLYFDALMTALKAQLVVTNYSFWIAQHRYSDGLGKFDLLVMDESHDAADELAASMEVELSEFDTQTLLGISLPDGQDASEWKIWAVRLLAVAQGIIDDLTKEIKDQTERFGAPDRKLQRESYHIKTLAKKITVIAQMEGGWVVERKPRHAKLAPIWPAPYADRYLFLDIKKIILVSATIRPKSLAMLGIKPGEFEFLEYPSTFPIARRPVLHVPTVRCRHTWSEIEQRTWVNRIDQIIDQRLDRKGIVHTMSYERRNLILTHSRHRDIMIANDSTNTRSVVERFRQMEPPAVLVSPSLTTGWDMPDDDCEYSIIAKIPFPDTRSSITEARTKQDPDYGAYVAMQTIVQASGRGMRSAYDQCEVFILDDQWRWFWPKYKHFAPNWFRAAVMSPITIPRPLPKLVTKPT